VPEDDPKFQGLLEEEEAPYPDMSAELPGAELESEETDEAPAITEEPAPSFEDLAANALDNAGINCKNMLQAAHSRGEHEHVPNPGPAIINANDDEIMYEIMFNLPDVGLHGDNAVSPDNAVECQMLKSGITLITERCC
jgi:hypothetical protein